MRDQETATAFAELMTRPNHIGSDKIYWDSIKKQKLVIQECDACGYRQHPPFPFCESCQEQSFKWPELGSTGTLFTFTVVHHPPAPELAAFVPYAIGLVEVDGMVDRRMVSTIIVDDASTLRVGANLQLVWLELNDGTILPSFKAPPTPNVETGDNV